jgi:hypothetical protein
MQMHEQHYQQDLGDGYTLRWANASDRDSLLDLYGYVFRDETSGAHNTYLMAYADDLLSGRHPMSSPAILPWWPTPTIASSPQPY